MVIESAVPRFSADAESVKADVGIVAVKVVELVPTELLPLKVSQVIVPVPLFASVSAEASEVGTVHLTDVEDVFVAIVPVFPLKE